MTLIHAPESEHSCDIDWERVPRLVPDKPAPWNPGPPPGVTHRLEMVHHFDAPGTVRQCPACGKFWVAERYPHPGTGGVFWRPEKRRERKRREGVA